MKDVSRKYVKEIKVTPEMYKENKIVPFFAKRKIYFTISIAIMLIGILFMFINGVQLDIQFKGGALIKYTYVGEIDADKAAEVATASLGRPVTTQVTEDIASKEQRLILNIAGNYGLDAAEREKFDAVLSEAFPNAQIEQAESSMVEPFFGKRFLRNGIISILLAGALVLIYVWIRFKKMGGLSAGATAIIALIHDVLIVFFTCVIFRIPIGESFVAVALSIIGYSINDTIVIYDRIRENTSSYIGYPLEAITDLSISQSMMRSINTSVAVFVSVSLVYILAFSNGIASIISFALPMAVGTISGCYSTICIAGPLWVMWKKKKGEDIIYEEKKPAPNY